MQQLDNLQPQSKLAARAVRSISVTLLSTPSISILGVTTMDKSKYTARINNIYFLDRIGESLRWATEDIAREELPANIRHLLARLDRLEARERMKRERVDNDAP